jgi:hypothetical protein
MINEVHDHHCTIIRRTVVTDSLYHGVYYQCTSRYSNKVLTPDSSVTLLGSAVSATLQTAADAVFFCRY